MNHWLLFPALVCSSAVSAAMLAPEAQWAAVRAAPERYATLLHFCDQEHRPQPLRVLAPEPHYTATGESARSRAQGRALFVDGRAAYRLALCYRLRGRLADAQGAQRILDAWAQTLTQVRGRQAFDDLNFALPYYALAGAWVQDVGHWDARAFRAFLKNVARPASLAWKNNDNHGDWGVLLDAAVGANLGDRALLRQTRARWQSLVLGQVDERGRLPRELCRSDTRNYCGGAHQGKKGLAYTHYALLPLTVAAQILAMQGLPVWKTAAGQKLALAYRQTAEWTQHPERSPYYGQNGGALLNVRNGAYFVLLQDHYPNAFGAEALRQGQLRQDGFYLNLLFGKKKPRQ